MPNNRIIGNVKININFISSQTDYYTWVYLYNASFNRFSIHSAGNIADVYISSVEISSDLTPNVEWSQEGSVPPEDVLSSYEGHNFIKTDSSYASNMFDSDEIPSVDKINNIFLQWSTEYAFQKEASETQLLRHMVIEFNV